MLGFLPGFGYLKGLPKEPAAPFGLAMTSVAAGAVAIAAQNSNLSGGQSRWLEHYRHDPFRLLQSDRYPPTTFAPLDTVAFEPISWHTIAN